MNGKTAKQGVKIKEGYLLALGGSYRNLGQSGGSERALKGL